MKTVEEVLAKRYEESAGKARVAKDLVDMDKVAGEGKRAQGARAGGAGGVSGQPGHSGAGGRGSAGRRQGNRSAPKGADPRSSESGTERRPDLRAVQECLSGSHSVIDR